MGVGENGRKHSAQKSAKKKPRGKPFQPGNPWRIKPGEVRNPGGRPKLLSNAYKEWLSFEDEQGVTNAAKLAQSTGEKAFSGDVGAVREMRQATEGDMIRFDRMTDDELREFIAKQLEGDGGGDRGSDSPGPVASEA